MTTTNPCESCGTGQTDRCFPAKPMSARTEILVITDTPVDFYPHRLNNLLDRLNRAGVDPERCVFTSVVKCIGKSWKEGKSHCINYIHQEVAAYRPKAVITVGKEALEAVFKTKSAHKAVGSVVQRLIGGHSFWSTYIHDLDTLDYMPEYVTDDAWAISRVLDVCDGLYPRKPSRRYNYSMVDTVDAFDLWVQEQPESPLLAMDIESGGTDETYEIGVGLDAWHPDSYLIGFSLCVTPGVSVFIHTRNNPELQNRVLSWLQHKWLILHNGKYDLNFIRVKTGVNLFPNFWSDTMLASHNFREWSKSHSLKWLASRWLPEFDNYEYELEQWFATNKINKEQKDYGKVPIDILVEYAAIDADVTLRLYQLFVSHLQQQNLWGLHRNQTMPMQGAYAKMEYFGWGHDYVYWKALKEEAEAEKLHRESLLRQSPMWDRFFRWKEWSMRNDGKAYWDDESKQAYVDSTMNAYATGGKFVHKNGNHVVSRTYTLNEVLPNPTQDEFKRIVLFGVDFFRINPPKLTEKTKTPSVDSATLRSLLKDPRVTDDAKEFITTLLDLEKVNKRLTTYLIPATPHYKDGKHKAGWIKSDGLIHAQYLLAGQDYGSSFVEGGTTSGRISSREPNMTNQPTRQGGKKNKRQFKPAPRDVSGVLYTHPHNGKVSYTDPYNIEWYFIQLDYSQLELRVLADVSNEVFMIKAYQADEDLHTKLAAQLFNRSVEWYIERLGNADHPEHELAFNERLVAKTSWFAVIYGSGPQKLVDILGLQGVVLDPDEEKALGKAREIIADLYKKLPYVRALKDDVRSNAPTCINKFGRRRTVLNVNSTNELIAEKGHRQLFNFLIQSQGSDVASAGIFRTIDWLEEQNRLHEIRAYPTGAVHDSFLIACPATEVDYIAHNAQRIMEDTSTLPWQPSIPFKVDVEFGPTWGDLRKWEPGLIQLTAST